MKITDEAAAPHMSGVSVKALEWDRETRAGWHEADSEFGTYRAYADGTVTLQVSYKFGRSWPDTEAAAQADYERRIMSALEPAPEGAGAISDGIADAVLSWMVKHDWLDAGNEYSAEDVITALDDNAGPEPVPDAAEELEASASAFCECDEEHHETDPDTGVTRCRSCDAEWMPDLAYNETALGDTQDGLSLTGETQPAEELEVVRRLNEALEDWTDLRDNESADLCRDALAIIEKLRAGRDAAILSMGEQARLRGEAEGALRASELAGVVEGWQRRAEAAEARLAEAVEALDQLLDDMGEDGLSVCQAAKDQARALLQSLGKEG